MNKSELRQHGAVKPIPQNGAAFGQVNNSFGHQYQLCDEYHGGSSSFVGFLNSVAGRSIGFLLRFFQQALPILSGCNRDTCTPSTHSSLSAVLRGIRTAYIALPGMEV